MVKIANKKKTFYKLKKVKKKGFYMQYKKPKQSLKNKPIISQEINYPHFRIYRKANHPALITSERSRDEYNFRKVMHTERDGERKNETVYPNPNPRDKEPMYIGKRIRHDKKSFFSSLPLPWKYPDKNKK